MKLPFALTLFGSAVAATQGLQVTKVSKFSNTGGAGSYQEVTNFANGGVVCEHQTKSVSGPLDPFTQSLTLAFRGPLSLDNVAVYQKGADGAWNRTSQWDHGNADHLTVLQNKKYVDGQDLFNFNGYLKNGEQMLMASGTKCDQSPGACTGFVRQNDNAYAGWWGEKIIVGRMTFPQKKQPSVDGLNDNLPAFWALNTQVVHTNQYPWQNQCNTRELNPANGGGGEYDIAECIPNKENKVTTTLYSYAGDVSNIDNFCDRNYNYAVDYAMVVDSSLEPNTIYSVAAQGFDYSQQTLSSDYVKQLVTGPDFMLSVKH